MIYRHLSHKPWSSVDYKNGQRSNIDCKLGGQFDDTVSQVTSNCKIFGDVPNSAVLTTKDYSILQKNQSTLISAASQDQDFANRPETRIQPNLKRLFDVTASRKKHHVEDLNTKQTYIKHIPTLTDLPGTERLI